jgi:hypothetical protein
MFKETGRYPTEDRVSREFFADYVSEQFGNPEFWDKVNKVNPKLMQRITTFVAEVLRKITKPFSNWTEGMSKTFFDDSVAMRDAAADMIAKYAETARNRRAVEDFTAAMKDMRGEAKAMEAPGQGQRDYPPNDIRIEGEVTNESSDMRDLREGLIQKGFEPAAANKLRQVRVSGSHAAAVEGLSRDFGTDIVWFVGPGRPHPIHSEGWSSSIVSKVNEKNPPIYINANSSVPLLQVFAHELTHTINIQEPAMFQEFVRVMWPEVKNEAWVNRYPENLSRSGLSTKQAMREFMSEYMAEHFTDNDFWTKLHDRNPALMQRVAKYVGAFMQKITRIVSNWPKTLAGEFINDTGKVKDAAVKMVSDFSERAKPPVQFMVRPAPSTTAAEPRVYSPKNAVNDALRERLNFPAMDRSEQHKWQAAMNEAEAKLKANPHVDTEIADSIRANDRPITDTEQMVLTRGVIDAMNVRFAARRDHKQAVKDNDVQGQNEALARERAQDSRIEALTWADSKVGTQAGRALNIRRAMLREDFTFENMERRKILANDGDPLTQGQRQEITDYNKRIAELQAKLDAATAAAATARDAGKPSAILDKRESAAASDVEQAKGDWRKTLDRDKRSGDRWVKKMDDFLAENNTTLDPKEHAEIAKLFHEAAKITDDAQRSEVIADAVSRVSSKVYIPKGSWFDAYVYTNMLSGPMSHARNTIGNFTNAFVLRPLSLAMRGQFKGAGEYMAGALKAIYSGEAGRAYRESWHTGEMSKFMETLDDPNMSAFTNAKLMQGPENAAARAAWKTFTATGRFMQAQDVWVGKMIEMGEVSRLMRDGKTFEAAHDSARKLAAEYLYRDRLKTPDKSLDFFTRGLEHIGVSLDHARRAEGVWGFLLKRMIPFLKTPVKIAELASKTSPFGFFGVNKNNIAQAHYGKSLDALKREASAATDAKARGELNAQIEEVEATAGERMGKAMIGTALTALGALAAASGGVVWKAPKDEKAKRLFYDAGYRPYSFRVGDKWIPMMYLGPFMIAFAIPAALKDVLIDDPNAAIDGPAERMIKVLSAVPEMIMNQLPLQGVASLLNTVTGKTDYTWARTTGQTISQVVPASGMLSWIRKFTDPTYRNPVTIAETIQANIPGLSHHVKAIADSRGLDAGQDVMTAFQPYAVGTANEAGAAKYTERMGEVRGNAERRAMTRTMNPIFATPSDPEADRDPTTPQGKVFSALRNWNAAQDDDTKKVNISTPDIPSVKYAGVEHKFTNDEYSQYIREAGELSTKRLATFRANVDAPSQQDVTYIKRMVELSRHQAKAKMLASVLRRVREDYAKKKAGTAQVVPAPAPAIKAA